MANSNTNLDLVSASQSAKEVTVNSALDAASPAMLYGRRAVATAGLTWGYYGGTVLISGTPTQIANGTVTLTASATNYVEANPATGAVSANTTAFTGGRTPLYSVIVGSATLTSYSDLRTSGGGASSIADGDKGDITVTGSGATWTIDSSVLSTFGRTLTDDADAAAARTTLGLAIGSNVQAYDAELAALAGLTSAADKGIQFTGAGTAATFDLTAAGKALLDDADAAAQRTTLGLGTAALLASDTDTSLAANSDTRVATQKAVKAYIDAVATSGATDVMIFKGVIDCSANPNYPAADAGNLYKVSVAGKIGGASGINVEIGDTLYCIADATSAGTQAAVGASWNISQVNVDGAVTGPASATGDRVALFNGSTGKIIKDSGLTLAGTNTGDETATTAGALVNGATAKTTPVDADYVGLMDSAASNVLKKVSWANIKAVLKAYFDTLYAAAAQPFDVHTFYPGVPTTSAKLYRGKLARAVAFSANFGGAQFTASANATASTVFDVQKNGTSVGTCTIAAGGITPTFASSGGAAVSFAAGDVFSVVAPATPDATLADPAITFAGTR